MSATIRMKTRALSIISKLTKTAKRALYQPKIDYLLLAILGLYIFHVWFQGHALYFGGDIIYPLRPSLNIDLLLYTWTNNNSGMPESSMMYYFLYGFFFITDKLGLSLPTAQRIYLFINFILPGLAMYYLTSVVYSKIYPNNNGKRIACWIAALFYMFCPTLLKQAQVYWFYGVFPFILAFFIKTVDAPDTKGKIKFSLLAALFCFGILLWLPNYQPLVNLFLVLALYSMGHLLFNRHKIKQLLMSLRAFCAVVILINLAVILPWLFTVSGQGGQILAEIPITAGGRWMDEGPQAMLRNLSLTFGLGPEGGSFLPTGFYYGPNGLGTALYFVNLFFPIAAFSALLLKPKLKMLTYFALIALIGLVISQGPNPPFGDAYKWTLENITILRGFRAVGITNVLIALGYAVLIGISISGIYRRAPEKISSRVKDYLTVKGKKVLKHVVRTGIVVIAITLIMINGWPMVTGAYFKTPEQWPNNQLQEVPSSYYELDDWLNERDNSRDYRLLVLPLVGYMQTTWPPHGYLGSHVAPFIFSRPVIFSAAGREGVIPPIVETIYDISEHDYDLMAKLAGLSNVKYFYVDGYDILSWRVGDPRKAAHGGPEGGYALAFDGTDDYVEVYNSASLYSNTLTIEAWIKTSVPDPQNIDVMPVVTKRGTGDEFQFGLWYGSVYILAWKQSGEVAFNLFGGTKITDKSWHHIVFTTNGVTAKTYLDGELQDSVSYNGTIVDTSSTIRIGNEPTMPRYFKGAIDEVRILNRALAADEVKASYNRKQAAMEDGVVAIWHFDEGSGPTVIDDSHNGNDGIILGVEYVQNPASIVPLYNYEQSFDKLDVYSIDDKYVFPRVYATSKIYRIDDGINPGILDFLQTTNFSGGKPVLLLSEQLSQQDWQLLQGLNSSGIIPEVTFRQLNPTKYVVHINSSTPCLLVLNTQFNPYWAAYTNDGEVDTHIMANSYANAWYINKTGSFDVILKYKVQDYFHITLVLSGLTLVGCLCYLGEGFFKKKKIWFNIIRSFSKMKKKFSKMKVYKKLKKRFKLARK